MRPMSKTTSLMTLSMAAGLLLSAQSAFGQRRPTPPEVFQSPVIVQITEGSSVSRGVGRVIFDQPAGKSRVRYAVSGQRQDIISRYDLGSLFASEARTCTVTPLTGPMPPTWAWVANSKQANSEVVDGVEVFFWTATFDRESAFGLGTGIERVATTFDDNTTPVVYELITPERTIRLRFTNLRTDFRAKSNLFKPGRRCTP